MKFISVCSGIEAASVAWNPLGWKAAMFAEIEPFPCSVLAHHYPTVPNRGDMTKFEDWPDDSIDLLCGGTPCQSFSVAGLRKGLDDPRGNLMLTYGAIAAKHRPRWLVWENVPGVLSSNGGRDFGSFLGLLGQLGYGFAYRILDAQHFGVPQRRRRVFVVGCLGDWRSAAAVLFERHSMSGHPAPRRETWQGVAGRSGDGVGSGIDTFNAAIDGDVAHTMPAGAGPGRAPHVFSVAHALTGEGFDASEDGTGRGTPLVPVTVGTLTSNGDAHSGFKDEGGLVPSAGMQVRRLLPVECEALQGFPRNYTAVPHRGKPAADGPRYKALGNSWAVPCARWIGERINAVKAIETRAQL